VKWFWIILGALIGVPLVYYFGYLLLASCFFPVKGDTGAIKTMIFYGITVMVICTAIIVNKLNKLKK
jgi:membrane protein DedA with SNARE-associated domain